MGAWYLPLRITVFSPSLFLPEEVSLDDSDPLRDIRVNDPADVVTIIFVWGESAPSTDGTIASATSSSVTGRDTTNFEPLPGVLTTKMFPPCNSITSLEMAKPKPMPPKLLRDEFVSCSKGSETGDEK